MLVGPCERPSEVTADETLKPCKHNIFQDRTHGYFLYLACRSYALYGVEGSYRFQCSLGVISSNVTRGQTLESLLTGSIKIGGIVTSILDM